MPAWKRGRQAPAGVPGVEPAGGADPPAAAHGEVLHPERFRQAAGIRTPEGEDFPEGDA